ncbi:MAG: hypothetical protein F4Z57_18650 [Gemmatimonadetes bacterium]|nr:hypothetical protein [Gemmatimonadota bacterium]MYC73280.1 hypothetical protein [Gemmatimonadota bacterium]MYI63368.1 hypothetical protein [Gemmatimonadota bacterium]
MRSSSSPKQAPIRVIRHDRPRLLRPYDDPDFRFEPSTDPVRRRILANLLDDCELYAGQRPWTRIPRRPDSPHPYHQLYLTFYTAMQATALIENYAFAWRLTGDRRWLDRTRAWLQAAAGWDHDDRVEEHFYTANRYMQAFALALDLLDGELTANEKRQVRVCLVRQLERWWPDVEEQRHGEEGGHHAVVDNGHFGVAALHLLGEHPKAEVWVQAVIDRFRAAIMPHGCGPAGEPVDGPSFWPWENLWLLQFADALHNVAGIDLGREVPARLRRPLTWFRAHWAAPRKIPDQLYYSANANVLGTQLNACSPALLRLAQEAGDEILRDAALADPRLGRIYRFGGGVKGSTAECMISYGPYAYCFYDPDFRAVKQRRSAPLARRFAARGGRSAVMRSGHGSDAAVLCVSGYDGDVAHGFMNLHVQWAGYPVLRAISAAEAQPVSCGSLPCVGGQNEIVAVPGGLESTQDWQRLRVSARRTEQEYWLLTGEHPVVLVALRRRPRGLRLVNGIVRLSGGDALQYEARPWFCSNGGRLRLRFRLRERGDPQVLFNTGNGVGGIGGTRVNTFALVVEEDGRMRFSVQSQNGHEVTVCAPGRVDAGVWHEVEIGWGGFNRREGRPWMEIAVDGEAKRIDDPATFGEVGHDSQGLDSREEPRTFYVWPHSTLAFGGAVQTPGVSADCDIALIDLRCPGRRRLIVDPARGLGPEMGGGELAYKLNPVDLRGLSRSRARLGAGPRAVEVMTAFGKDLRLRTEEVPFAPSGLAAGSLVSFLPGAAEASTRIVAGTDDDVLVLAFCSRSAKARVTREGDWFRLRAGDREFCFDVVRRGSAILRPT